MKSIIAALLLLVSTSSPPPSTSDRRICVSKFGAGNRSFTFWVSEAQLMQSADWTPASGAIPVSLDDALGLAQEWFQAQGLDFAPNDLQYIRLRQPSSSTRWMYELCFQLSPGHRSVAYPVFFLVVLLDRTVVPPTEWTERDQGKKSGA